MVQSLPTGTEEKALWVWLMVVVKQITDCVVETHSAFVAPLCEVLLKWQKLLLKKKMYSITLCFQVMMYVSKK